MKEIAYYNGEFCKRDEAVVPLNDRGFYFGDGVYEALYAENHIPFAIDEHLDRLFNSLSFMRIPAPMPREAIKALVMDAAAQVDANEQMIYFQITRAVAPRVHAFPDGELKSSIMLFAEHHPLRDLRVKYNLVTTPDTRWLHCNIKTLNLIPSVMAAELAKENGCMEAVFHRDGMVTECASSNIFIIENGVLRTAPANNLILAGITRKHMLELAKERGIPTREEPFTLDEMMAADEVMVTSTSTHGAWIGRIDGKSVGGRNPELIAALQRAYRDKVVKETTR